METAKSTSSLLLPHLSHRRHSLSRPEVNHMEHKDTSLDYSAHGEDYTGLAINNDSVLSMPKFKDNIVHSMTAMEALLVALCLLLWAMSVAVFLRKWGRIRVLQPQEPRYRYSPKNLESIKVIENASQSIIYEPGHYKQRASNVGIADLVRQSARRMPMPSCNVQLPPTVPPDPVRRMSTMPNIKVPSNISGAQAANNVDGVVDLFGTMRIIRTTIMASNDDVTRDNDCKARQEEYETTTNMEITNDKLLSMPFDDALTTSLLTSMEELCPKSTIMQPKTSLMKPSSSNYVECYSLQHIQNEQQALRSSASIVDVR